VKATTVREIDRLVQDVARQRGITVEAALDAVKAQYDMVCFMGMWDNPQAEVLVPDSMPVASGRAPVAYVIY